ncbi:MAG: hypothetical protein AAF806_02860 [Bacteroidota bacterium]
MIVFGWNKSTIAGNRPQDVRCFNCEQSKQIILSKFVKTFHLMFIPIFAYRVGYEFQCKGCKCNVEFKDMNNSLKQTYYPYRPKRIIPFWHFSGVLLILGILAWNKISDFQNRKILAQEVSSLEVGHLVDYKDSDDTYSIFKICSIAGDDLFVTYNKFQVDSERGLIGIDEPTYYSTDTVVITRTSMLQMIRQGEIIDVHR